MSEATWWGVLDADVVSPHVQLLSDAARDGSWDRVLERCADRELVNAHRPGGTSLYAPLHQAAWHGASTEVVEQLLLLGAWRTLRTAKGERALDIAQRKGHRHLVDLLTPPVTHVADPEVLGWLDLRLAELVERRIRPDLTVRLRHPCTEVLTELDPRGYWYPVPGMYGGFHVRLREAHLYVTSWCRVVGGSGQAHVVTREGAFLVDEGFV